MQKSRLIPGAARPCVAAAAGALALTAQWAIAGPSIASTDACREESGAVRVCSTKELSNVVLQCGDESIYYFVKYDELDDGTYDGLIDPYSGFFNCPSGEVMAVFIKSGNNRYSGAAIEGLPPGSGAQWTPLACSDDAAECGTSDEGGDENADARG